MKSVSRNVIIDLLPAYIAGEASPESRALIEEFARNDAEIANTIRAGMLDPAFAGEGPAVPDNLEMKAIERVRRGVHRKMLYTAAATAAVLMIPLTAMQFTDEVNWDLADFLVMAILLFGAGAAYILMTRVALNSAFRAGIAVAVLTSLLLTWVNLAVGIIGSAGNPLNLLYFGVILIGIVGAWIARLQPPAMFRTMLAVAAVQLLIPIVALLLGAQGLDEPRGAFGLLLLNGGFAVLFGLSAYLFWRADRTPPA